MGNSNASAKGKLGVVFDAPAVYAGQAATGKIYLEVTEEIKARCLDVILDGGEKSHVVYKTGSGRNVTTHHRYGKRDLFYLNVSVHKFKGGKVAPGRYVFPFSARLPSSLPSTMSAGGGDGGDCSIAYQLEAHLGHPLDPDHLKACVKMHVQAKPLSIPPTPHFAKPESVPVVHCCCIPRGEATLGASVADTLVSKGQNVRVAVACQNNTTVQPNSLRVEIVEKVWWTAAGRRRGTSRTIAAGEFSPSEIEGLREMSVEDYDSMQEARRSKSNKAWSIFKQATARQHNRDILRNVYESLESERHTTDFTCHEHARDTYEGGVLGTSHFMRVYMKNPCCITDPEIVLPVRIADRTPPGETMQLGVPAVKLVEDEEERETRLMVQKAGTDWATSAIRSAEYTIPMSRAVVGGVAADGDAGASAPKPKHFRGTLEGLIERMSFTPNDFAYISEILSPSEAPTWGPLLSTLDPPSFACIVFNVDNPLDRPKTAELLGLQLRAGVTVKHIVQTCAKLKSRPVEGFTSEGAEIVKKLAPLCKELARKEGREEVEAVLDDWERVVANAALDAAQGRRKTKEGNAPY